MIYELTSEFDGVMAIFKINDLFCHDHIWFEKRLYSFTQGEL